MRRAMWVLLGATLLFSASSSVIFALLGNLQDQYGFSDAGLGFITAAGFGASFVVQLTIAPLADRGHPKRLLLVGALTSVAGNLAFASSDSLWGLVGSRAVIGASVGCFIPAARALVASLSVEKQGERLGRMASFEVAGFVFGPVVGGALVGPLGVRWPFVLFSVAAALAFVLVFVTPLPTLPRSSHSGRIAVDLLKVPAMVVAMLVAVALALPIGMYDALWDRFLTDRGASDLLVGVSLAAYGIPFVLLATLGGRLADRVGPLRLALRCLMIIVPFTAMYGWFHNPWIPISIGVTEAVIQAAANPAAQALVAGAAPPGRAAAAQGLVGAANVLTAAVVAIVASSLYGAFGAETVFMCVAGASATFALAAWALSRRLSAAHEDDPHMTMVPS